MIVDVSVVLSNICAPCSCGNVADCAGLGICMDRCIYVHGWKVRNSPPTPASLLAVFPPQALHLDPGGGAHQPAVCAARPGRRHRVRTAVLLCCRVSVHSLVPQLQHASRSTGQPVAFPALCFAGMVPTSGISSTPICTVGAWEERALHAPHCMHAHWLMWLV